MYRVRFLLMMLACWASKKSGLPEDYELSFRAIPFLDTDVTRTLTHAYAAFSGLGRRHYVIFVGRWRSRDQAPMVSGDARRHLPSSSDADSVRSGNCSGESPNPGWHNAAR